MMSIWVLWRRIPGPGIALLREPITCHFRSSQIPGSLSYWVPGTRSGCVQKPGSRHTLGGTSISRSGHGSNSHRDKRSRSQASSFSDSDESSSAIILDQVLLGHVPGRGQENILERRSLIVIGLILETLIDGDTKDIVLDLVHVVTRDLDVIIIPEVGSDHVTSVTVLVDLPLSKKRGVKFLALLLLIEI